MAGAEGWRGELARDWRFVWRSFCRTWKRCWLRALLLVAMLFVLTGAVLFPWDGELLAWVRGGNPERWEGLEDFLATWGDWLIFNVGLGVILLLAGILRRDPWLRRIALIFFLSGALSGLSARVVKMTTGRARPSAVEKFDLSPVTFRGPGWRSKFHGYFSGHTAATWGAGVALAIMVPRAAIFVLVFVAAVGWSRMYGNHHYPSDVAHGAIWGVAWGWLVASGPRRAKKLATALRAARENSSEEPQ